MLRLGLHVVPRHPTQAPTSHSPLLAQLSHTDSRSAQSSGRIKSPSGGATPRDSGRNGRVWIHLVAVLQVEGGGGGARRGREEVTFGR